MRVAVVNLTSGGLSGGARKYILQTTPLFLQGLGADNLQIYVPPAAQAELQQSQSSPLQTWPANDSWIGFPALRRKIRDWKPDVVLIPTARWLDCKAPLVAMVRNMEPFVDIAADNPWIEKLKNKLRAREARRACRRATRIIAISQFVRDYLVSHHLAPEEKLALIYHGIEEHVKSNGSVPPAAMRGRSEPFFFTAGSIRPFRGLEDAVRALIEVRRGGREISLVIAGNLDGGMQGYKQFLNSLAAAAGCASSVVWTGSLPPRELSWCYRNSLAFIMTSRTEACPNIALEAMSERCMIVSTRNPPMPEFFLENALYYMAGDAQELSRQLNAVLAINADERERRGNSAAARAAGFSWQKCVNETLELMQRAAACK